MTNDWPLVSIVLSTYNGAKFIAEQLQSLEKQTYPNIQFICCDNNSTDGTTHLLKEWCDTMPDSIFLIQREKGLNKAFFYAARHASGEYIMFCDQDDIWVDSKVEQLVAFHQLHPDAGMVYCLSKPFREKLPENMENTGPINRIENSDVRQTMLISFTMGHNICIRKKVYDKLPEIDSEIIAYDWWITVGAMLSGGIKCLKKNLTYWRRHSQSTSDAMNDGLFWQQRIRYLKEFYKHPLMNADNRIWIGKAIEAFQELGNKKFSVQLFKFLMSNARVIYFYKPTKVASLEWLSYLKWSYKLSRRSHRV